ncbi:MAG: hypothetical protein ABII18_12665 [bacterium]
MKTITVTLLTILLISIVFVSCKNRSKLYELPKPVEVNNAVVALEKGTFEIVPDASWFIIRFLKNDHIPVKASINVLDGSLNVNNNALHLAEVTLDMSSWDSSLSERDKQIKSILFHLDNDVNQKALLKVLKAKQDLQKALSENKKIKELPIQINLRALNKDHTLEAVVSLTINEKNRLVITTIKPLVLKQEAFLSALDLELLKDLRKIDSLSETFEVSVHLEFISPVVISH